ncbi:hypothetical protein BT96DRAFT_1026753 [Gymnopus androsaceus JB14]|uniref:Uncharacterized protein n=1 Tax=Gymnopus androsaceus JB14 TaxID=1447944 RepID=A0A6A4GH14_9AGAR|nr:hypothetical protein BT96DRAFT_1026753 [Gymnopus androsaceus JB14]
MWPHFTPTTVPAPEALWARLSSSAETSFHHLNDAERALLHKNLVKQMSYNSARHVGDVHRALCAPLSDGGLKILSAQLAKINIDALKYVCVDLNCLPRGKLGRLVLVQALIDWRKDKPTEPLPRAPIDSSAVLHRLHKAIREIIHPSWIKKPPHDVGLPRAGTLKAEHWKTLFAIFIPLALLSLWQPGSPISAQNAAQMGPALDTTMHLTCASIAMHKLNLTGAERERFRHLYRQHIFGLKANFPGFELPTHHLGFHIYDFMDQFGSTQNWSCYRGERLIGKLRRIPINHKIGEFEGTLLQSFHKGSAFRRWLMRPDCPRILKTCRNLLDKAFGYVSSGNDDDDGDDSETDSQEEWFHSYARTPTDLIPELGISTNALFLPRIEALFGYYTVPGAPGKGNSYVCFYPHGDTTSGWVAGRIHYIFKKDATIKLALRRNLSLAQEEDPFSVFWNDGFESKLVSTAFSEELEVVEPQWILGHTAMWELNAEVAVVLAIPKIAGEPVKPWHQPIVKFQDMIKELQNGGEADSERDEEDVVESAPVLYNMILETGPPIAEQSNAKARPRALQSSLPASLTSQAMTFRIIHFDLFIHK